jgi:2-oxoglutarate dehydrogenase E1 component
MLAGLLIHVFIFFQSWDSFFRNASAGAGPGQAYQAPPSLAVPGKYEIPITALVPQMSTSGLSTGLPIDEKIIGDHLAVQAIIRSYQVIKKYVEKEKKNNQGPAT